MPKKKKRPLRKSVSRTSKMARSQNVPSKQQRDHNEGEHYSQTPTLFKASVDSEKAPRAKTRKAA